MKNKKVNLMNVVRDKIMQSGSEDLSGRPVMFINPYSYLVLRDHPHLLMSAGRIGIDGQLLVRILSVLLFRRINRVSFDMTSLAPVVFQRAVETRQRVYVIGSTQTSLTGALNFLVQRYPELSICGSRDGYFADDQVRTLALENVVRSRADILICGLGTPQQERFLHDLSDLGWGGTGYTCGGFLHQTAKKGGRYYPEWVDRCHLRWAYRIYDEPKLFKRYFLRYPVAILFIVKDYISAVIARTYV